MAVGPFEFLLVLGLGVLWIVALWVICGKIGWNPALSLLVFVPIVGVIFGVMTVWEALGKAGHSRWLTLVLLIPLVNLVFTYWLAFSTWPSESLSGPAVT